MPVRLATRHKFNAKAVTIDGHRFPSLAEGRRYSELKMLERAGEIRNLTLQPCFVLMAPVGVTDRIVRVKAIGEYRSDFQYERRNGSEWTTVTEDVKGVATELYRWKRKHVMAQYGVEIVEIGRRSTKGR